MDPLPTPQMTSLLGLFLLDFSVESWTRKERILRVVSPPFVFIHIKYKKYYIYIKKKKKPGHLTGPPAKFIAPSKGGRRA